MKTTEQRLIKIVAEQLGWGVEQITPEKSFAADLGADSLDIVELAMAIEDEFAIEIDDEEGEKLRTVQQAIDYVHKQLPA